MGGSQVVEPDPLYCAPCGDPELVADYVNVIRRAVAPRENQIEIGAVGPTKLQPALLALAGAMAAQNIDGHRVQVEVAPSAPGRLSIPAQPANAYPLAPKPAPEPSSSQHAAQQLVLDPALDALRVTAG